ncbi:hypothetical protein AgCh_036609 [Apium graveolens]
MVNPIVEDFMKGKSGMLAALGPSGSGKTHMIFGTTRQPGMILLALRRIFLGTEGNGAQPSGSAGDKEEDGTIKLRECIYQGNNQ